jgi:transcriptional regulator with XRE-family HTH domain
MRGLGQRIRKEGQKQNLTLEQLSQLTKLLKRILRPMKPDVAQPSISNLMRVAQIFNIRNRDGILAPASPRTSRRGMGQEEIETIMLLTPLVFDLSALKN